MKANEDQFNVIKARITQLNEEAPFHRDCTGILDQRSVHEIRESNYGWLLNPFIAYVVLVKSHALMLFFPLPPPIRLQGIEVFVNWTIQG